MKVIYDVGGGTGEWSRWYRMAGYDVRIIDPAIWPYALAEDGPDAKAHGVLLAVPCKEFVVSGARWWAQKDPKLLKEATRVARAFLDFKDAAKPVWWALENPIGRMQRLFPELGKPYIFHPYEYGDPWFKQTCIWGSAKHPKPTHKLRDNSRITSDNSRIHVVPAGPYRSRLRAITPTGFAKAFFEANP